MHILKFILRLPLVTTSLLDNSTKLQEIFLQTDGWKSGLSELARIFVLPQTTFMVNSGMSLVLIFFKRNLRSLSTLRYIGNLFKLVFLQD